MYLLNCYLWRDKKKQKKSHICSYFLYIFFQVLETASVALEKINVKSLKIKSTLNKPNANDSKNKIATEHFKMSKNGSENTVHRCHFECPKTFFSQNGKSLVSERGPLGAWPRYHEMLQTGVFFLECMQRHQECMYRIRNYAGIVCLVGHVTAKH